MPPAHPLLALLHESAVSFDQLYSTIHQHDASNQHYINLVLPLTQHDMADKLHRIEMVSFELGMAQSNAMRMGRELDVMGAGMEKVRERLSKLIQREAGVDEVMSGSGQDGLEDDIEVKREGAKRSRDEQETNGEVVTAEQKLQRLASDAG